MGGLRCLRPPRHGEFAGLSGGEVSMGLLDRFGVCPTLGGLGEREADARQSPESQAPMRHRRRDVTR